MFLEATFERKNEQFMINIKRTVFLWLIATDSWYLIKKALIVNCLFLGFCVVLSIFFSIIISKKSSKGSTILVLKSLFSLYRAFAPIVSSIYCFDVIRCLFQQIFETAVDALRNEYERARGLL